MELWKTVCEQWDWILFLLFVVKTVVLPATAIWLSVPLVEDPSQTDCTSVCTCTTVCTNCTTVCNRVYNNGFCRPVDLLHIARNKSSTHFNVTTYEAIPTHVPWKTSTYATVVVAIAVAIAVLICVVVSIQHWDAIVSHCQPYCTFEYAKNAMLCVFGLATILLSEPRLLEPRKWLRESGAV